MRTAVGILMVVYALVYGLATFAAFHRRAVWDRWALERSLGNRADLKDADTFVNGAVGTAGLIVLAIAILLTVWSARVAGNARAAGRPVSGLAAGGWWIPIAWFVVPFVQLRRALGGRGNVTALGLWQLLFIGGFGICRLVELRFRPDFDLFDTVDDVSNDLRAQGITFAITTVVVAAAAAAAIAAMRSVDEVTSAGAPASVITSAIPP